MTIRRMLMAAVLWTAASLTAQRAGAQTITGTVVDQAGRPVAGVLVQMLDSASNVAAHALSTEQGTFRVAATRPGSYRLRTMRIGFRPTTSDAVSLPAGAEVERRIVLSGVQVQLDTIRVVDRSSCRVTTDSSAAATFSVFEQARTALSAAQITMAGRAISATTVSYERTLDPDGRRVIRQTSRLNSAYVAQPWLAAPPDSLHRAGFVVTDRDNAVTYFAPGIEVLLSDMFVEDHCFRLTEDSKQHSVVGLAFEPSPDRKGTPEIRGTLWLDRKTAELRRMDYRYVNVSQEQEFAGAGGEVEFARLRNGGWTISRWSIRMPVLEQVVQRLALGGTRNRVGEIRVSGGDLVLAIAARTRDTVWSRPPLTLRGTIVDSATRATVARADVSLAGTALSATTDDRGRFAIAGVLPGTYVAETQTPDLAAIGATNQTTITFDDSTKTFELRVPTASQLAAAVCQTRPLSAGTGAVLGRVFQRGDTVPAPGVRVVAEWTVMTPQSGNRLQEEGRRLEGRTTADGTYRLCGIPVNTTISLTATSPSSISDALGVRMSGRFARADLMMDHNVGHGATFTGAVLVDSLKTPIVSAEVSLPELSKTTVTAADGSFRLADIPAGEHRVVVRRVGYGPLDTRFAFGVDAIVNRQIFLARVRVLDSVVVTDRATEQRMREFEENRRVGLGHFLDRTQIEKLEGFRTQTAVQQWPGLSVGGLANHGWVVGTRKGPPLCPSSAVECLQSHGFYVPEAWEKAQGVDIACYALVYLDETLMNRGNPTRPFDLNSVPLTQIEAIEWFAGAAETPMRYSQTGSACGVMVIHTRKTP